MSLRMNCGVNPLLLYFTNVVDCCHCGLHFLRAHAVHAVKKTLLLLFLLRIGSHCNVCSSVDFPSNKK